MVTIRLLLHTQHSWVVPFRFKVNRMFEVDMISQIIHIYMGSNGRFGLEAPPVQNLI